MTSPSSPPASALKATPNTPDAAKPPFPPAPIEEWLRLIAKAGRAHQLYLPNNPIYRGAIDALRAGFRPIWQHTEEFSLTIGETDLRWYDVVVSGESNTEKNLKSGVAALQGTVCDRSRSLEGSRTRSSSSSSRSSSARATRSRMTTTSWQ